MHLHSKLLIKTDVTRRIFPLLMKKMKHFIAYRMFKKYKSYLSFNKSVVRCQLPLKPNNINNAMKESKDSLKVIIQITI